MDVSLVFCLGFLGIALLIIAAMGIRAVRPIERGLVERMGKYNSYKEPGMVILLPLLDRLVSVNITEQMVDATKQEVITKDALNATVDAQIYFKVKPDEESVKRSQYAVADYYVQIVQLARTTLRAIIGEMTLTEANSNRLTLNNKLAEALSKETATWGIDVIRAELKEIRPPDDVQNTMNEVVKAEKTKVAALDYASAAETKADGERRAMIKIAEAERQSRILQAQGEASYVEALAKAKADQIKIVNESAQKYFVGQAVELKKLEIADSVLRDNTKIIVPEGSNLINVIGDTMGLKPIVLDKKK